MEKPDKGELLMARDDKRTAVAALVSQLRDSQATVVTEYRGLTVAELGELRRALGPDTTYTVAKNTLAKRAAIEAGATGLGEIISGPSAWAFIRGDVVAAAKGLRDFARAHQALVIKGGEMDGALLAPADIARLADLESREALLAKLAGAMQGALQQTASLLAAPASRAARAMAALQAKAADGAAAAPEGGTAGD